LLNPSNRQHIALLYENKADLDRAIAVYLNEGLRRGQVCVYATVHYRDEGHIDNFSKLIDSYEDNVEKDNLLVVDLAPFYVGAMVGDLKLFNDAKEMFADSVKKREDKHIRFVGDGTGFLFKNKHFDECVIVEDWWQDKPFEGSYVCPYPKQFLSTFPHDSHLNRAIAATHDTVVDASGLWLDNTINRGSLEPYSSQQIQDYNSKNGHDVGGAN